LSWTSQYGGRRAEAVIAGLARGWPKDRPPKLDDVDKSLVDLFGKLPPRGRTQLLELASRWHSKALEEHSAEIASSLLAEVLDGKAKDADRVAAASQLIDLRRQDADSAGKILAEITPQTAPEL